MFKNGVASMFIKSLAIDLGTVNTLIARRDRGIVLKETSAVALSTDESAAEPVLAVGNEAMRMLGRTPGGLNVIYPMRDGVVADRRLTETMLKYYIERALGHRVGALGIRLIMCLPMCVTDVERRALVEAARAVGAREIMLLDEPLAAAIGAGLPVSEPVGSMVVDVGGGTTDIAVVALNGVAASKSIRVGGTHIDEAISAYVQKRYGIVIGARTAEDVKKTIGSAVHTDIEHMQIKGRCVSTGLPVGAAVSTGEIYAAIQPIVSRIVDAVIETLSVTPPELAGDICDMGITLCGGGALLHGLDTLISDKTGMIVNVDNRPFECVILGALDTLNARYDGEEAVYPTAVSHDNAG